jgi:hypothetical protein
MKALLVNYADSLCFRKWTSCLLPAGGTLEGRVAMKQVLVILIDRGVLCVRGSKRCVGKHSARQART